MNAENHARLKDYSNHGWEIQIDRDRRIVWNDEAQKELPGPTWTRLTATKDDTRLRITGNNEANIIHRVLAMISAHDGGGTS